MTSKALTVYGLAHHLGIPAPGGIFDVVAAQLFDQLWRAIDPDAASAT